MKWLAIDTQQYSENTPEYGHGDYPDQISYILAVVEADTIRKAQNAVKKIAPNVRFGGMFSPHLMPANTDNIMEYIKLDDRLHGKAYARHLAAVKELTS